MKQLEKEARALPVSVQEDERADLPVCARANRPALFLCVQLTGTSSYSQLKETFVL